MSVPDIFCLLRLSFLLLNFGLPCQVFSAAGNGMLGTGACYRKIWEDKIMFFGFRIRWQIFGGALRSKHCTAYGFLRFSLQSGRKFSALSGRKWRPAVPPSMSMWKRQWIFPGCLCFRTHRSRVGMVNHKTLVCMFPPAFQGCSLPLASTATLLISSVPS